MSKKTQKLLADADIAFDSGNFREGAGMMWEAARLSIVAVADAKGWPSDTYDDLKQVIHRLDRPNGRDLANGRAMHLIKFGVAEGYREQADTGDDEWEFPEFKWDDMEFAMYQASLKSFVAILEDYLDGNAKSHELRRTPNGGCKIPRRGDSFDRARN